MDWQLKLKWADWRIDSTVFNFLYSFHIRRDGDGFGRGRAMDQGRNGGGRFGSPDFQNGDMNMMMMLEESAVSLSLCDFHS